MPRYYPGTIALKRFVYENAPSCPCSADQPDAVRPVIVCPNVYPERGIQRNYRQYLWGTFYDSGGSGGNYGNNESYTMTFCSNSANCVQLNFTSFRTQGGNDILYLYDGPNTSAPLIGNFSGTTSPGTVVSSTGCITVRFVSNGSNTRGGWAATVSCVACGTATNMSNTTVTTCSGNSMIVAVVPAPMATTRPS